MTVRRLVCLIVAGAIICGCARSATGPATIDRTDVPTSNTTAAAPRPTVVTTTTTPVATTTPATTSTVGAPATTEATPASTAPSTAKFQALMDRYDAVVVRILADPRVASDPTTPDIVEFLSLFPKDSSFAAGTLKVWVDEGAKGRFYRPGSKGTMMTSRVQKVTPESETLTRFTVCSLQTMNIVNSSGETIEASGGVFAGTMTAVKVGNSWLLRDLSEGSTDPCPKAGEFK